MSPDEPPATRAHEDEVLKALSEQLNDPCLKSSTRILILVSLAINTKLGFLDLLRLTGQGKGSLSNHLEKLEAADYIKTKRTMIFGGHRVMVELTQKGVAVYENYMRTMRVLSNPQGSSNQNDTPM